MTEIRTSLPIPTQPWEAARERLCRGLLPHERDLYSNATLENLFYDASSSQQKHARGSRIWRLQERLAPLTESLEDYGSLRIILVIAAEAAKFQESLVDMLAQIGDVLPRFRIHERLFKNHERLLVALSKVYFDVLQFCIASKDLFTEARKSKISLSIVLRGVWKSHLREFDTYMARFRAHSKRVEKEAWLAHMIESARIRDIEIQIRALQLHNARYEKRNRILASLPAVDYLNKQSKLSASKHAGTCEWLPGCPEIKAWYTKPSSGCISCYGIPGSGKSVLAASLRDFLAEDRPNNKHNLVCYYYCDYSDKPSLQMRNILGSLIKQALERLHLDQFGEDFNCPYRPDRDPPTQDEGFRYLLDTISTYDTVYLILDGIDELDSANQTKLLFLIDQLIDQAPRAVKIFVTSRTEEFRIKNSLKLHPAIYLSSTFVDNDISLFIKNEIDKMPEPHPLALDHDLSDEVVQKLVKGAKGMFLWAKFQLADIEEALTKNALQGILENLPESLSEIYLRIMRKTAQGPGSQAKLDMMWKVFRWVAVAQRPLHIEELEEAVALESTDTYLHTDRIPKDAGSKLISCCSNLVVLNNIDNTVAFSHYTVEQFLFSTREESDEMLKLIDLTSSDDEVGKICLAYLAFSDFDTQLVKAPTQVQIEAPLADGLVWSSIPFGRHVEDFLTRTTPWRTKSQFSRVTPVKFALPSTSKPSEVLNKKYTLLDYIIEYWVYHTSNLEPRSEAWSKLRHLALYRQLDFEFRPWNDDVHLRHVEAVATSFHSLDLLELRVPVLPGELSALMTTNEYQTKLAIYAWAMKYGVSGLFHLLDRESLNQCFHVASLTSAEFDFVPVPTSDYFKMLADSLQTEPNSHESIIRLRQSAGWTNIAMARMLCAVSNKKDNRQFQRGPQDIPLPEQLRSIFCYEITRWAEKALLVDAAHIAVQAGQVDVFRFIWYALRENNPEWQLSNSFKVIEALLCASTSHLFGIRSEWDVIFILKSFLISEELVKTIQLSPTCRANPRVSQMLLVMVLISQEPISRIVDLWNKLDLRGIKVPPFDPMGDKDHSAFKSEKIILDVRPFLQTNVLALIEELAGLQLLKKPSFYSRRSFDDFDEQDMLSIVAIWDKYARCFSIGIFENDSLGLLKWAIKRGRIDAASALVPLYQEYAKERAGRDLVKSLHTEAKKTSDKMLEVLSPLWDFI